MGGYNELTAIEAYRVLDKLCQLFLQGDGQTVFRLVQKVKRVFLDGACEINVRAFSVGFASRFLGQATGGKLGF